MNGTKRDGPAALSVFLVAGETSGDFLGARLMQALARRASARFAGVGGAAMAGQGLNSLFPMEDLTAMGFGAVLAKLPLIDRRLRQTVAAVVAAKPDVLVLIDSPDFTHHVARRVRRALPELPIVKYVAPTVWAWRPGRARAMRPKFDHVLALYPFEPEVMQRLGGPPCTYVGHPLLERLEELRPAAAEAAARERKPPLLLVLPGSRRFELDRLAAIFGQAAARIVAAHGPVDLVLPTPPALATRIEAAIANWPVKPRVVTGEAEKYAAFRRARAALAASGTVTLELALAHVPMVTAYRVPLLEAVVWRAMVSVNTPILPNLVLGENVVPCFLQRDCTPENLSAALLPLFGDGARSRQLAAFDRLDELLGAGGEAPSARAARVVIETFEKKTGRNAPLL